MNRIATTAIVISKMQKSHTHWIPGTRRHDVKVLQYADHLKIYHQRKQLGRYPLPPDGVRNEVITPEGRPKPPQRPMYRKKPTVREEKVLRSDKALDDYLNFALPKTGKARHHFIRAFFGLYQKTAHSVFIQAIQRALKYRIKDIKTIENILVLILRDGSIELGAPEIEPDFTKRDTYIEGCFTDEPDLSIYEDEDD